MPIPQISLTRLDPKHQPNFKWPTGLTQAHVDQFNASAENYVKALNQLITEFNQAETKDKKLIALQAIKKLYNQMNSQYSLDLISLHKSYQEQIQRNLGNAILEQSKLLEPEKKTTPLETVIANMSQETLSEFMAILWKNPPKIEEVLTKFDFKNDTAAKDEFMKFLTTHRITPINQSMEGNSRNFIIEKKPRDPTNPTFVLKVDARLGNAKSAEDKLRESGFQRVYSSYGEERQATFTAPNNQPITAGLVLTNFFHNSDLYHYMCNQRKTNVFDVGQATNFFIQMSTMMSDMQSHGVVLPDAKLENWMVNDNNELIITDTKSLAHVTPPDTLDYYSQQSENKWIGLIWTHHLTPPEFIQRTPFSVDKMNSYLLGKNIYLYLTNCSNTLLDHKHSFNDVDFNHEIFKTPVGKVYKNLIISLVKPNAKERISIKEAQAQLQFINDHLAAPQLLETWTECQDLLNKINDNKSAFDVTMTAFISEMTEKMKRGQNDPLQLEDIRKELTETLKVQNELKACNEVLDLIKSDMSSNDSVMTLFINDMTSRLDNCNNNLNIIEDIKNTLLAKQNDQIAQKKSIIDEYNEITKQLDSHSEKLKYSDSMTLGKAILMLKEIKETYTKALTKTCNLFLAEMTSSQDDIAKKQFLKNKQQEIMRAQNDIPQLKRLVKELQETYVTQKFTKLDAIISQFIFAPPASKLSLMYSAKTILQEIESEINKYVTRYGHADSITEKFQQFKERCKELDSQPESMTIDNVEHFNSQSQP